MTRLPILFCLLLACALVRAEDIRGEYPFLKKGDVIALVGGEDIVAASEYGALEFFLTRALPDYHLKFRSLAWEGDTVFEQPRQLNFPTWEQQLEKIGATVVICQFGQMECLAGKKKLPEFIAAYEKLLVRFSGEGKRRIALLAPFGYEKPEPASLPDNTKADIGEYREAVENLGRNKHCLVIDYSTGLWSHTGSDRGVITRDGVHLKDGVPHDEFGFFVAFGTGISAANVSVPSGLVGDLSDASLRLGGACHAARSGGEGHELLQAIIAKNRLWFDYWRPQNWAFLNGDRITQPSSRDHRDPNVRWFPAEMEQFLPLIAAKEEEIWKLAAALK